jgi:protein-L-isoaspartate(D-aspartate) O-methyltransferase
MLARRILTLLLPVLPVLPVVLGCERGHDRPDAATTTSASVAPHPMAEQRRELLRTVRASGVDDERVLAAIGRVPREQLVPADVRTMSYEDHPLPIGEGQTISQPSLVALMTQLAKVDPGDKVLEVGTGSGYQAAVLAELTDKVYTIEIVEPLASRARKDLERLGYGDRVHVRIGDGYAGWKEHAPFDAIVVTAAPPDVPPPLKEQLAVGGRLVIPVGEHNQELRVIERTADGFVEHASVLVRFVPMTGRAQQRDR